MLCSRHVFGVIFDDFWLTFGTTLATKNMKKAMRKNVEKRGCQQGAKEGPKGGIQFLIGAPRAFLGSNEAPGATLGMVSPFYGVAALFGDQNGSSSEMVAKT